MARGLGLHERYSIARTNVGFAPIVTFHARLQSPCTSEALTSAITAILAKYPLLRCSVVNSRTPFLSFEVKEFHPNQILLVDESWSESAPEQQLLRMIQHGHYFDIERGPLWRVVLFGPTSIGLSIHHVISDGTGTRSLLAELLRLLRSPRDLPVLEQELPPTLEETMDIRPTWSQMLSTVFTELAVPRLPTFIQPTLPPPAFPDPISVSPFLCQPRLLILALPSTLLSSIESAGRAHGVETLNPIIQIAALGALRVTAPTEPEALLITSETSLSERSPSLGHPSSTCNYVSCIRDEQSVTIDTPFWSTCRSYAALLLDPHQRTLGRGVMGMMAYIPDGVVQSTFQGRVRTGWEVFLERQRDTFSGPTFEVSNLGLMEETEPAEIYWARTPNVVGATIALNVLSTRDGRMTITIGWREGVLQEQYVRDFASTMERLLRAIGEEETEDDASIGILSR